MASFFYGNGFQNIIDQKDYQNPKFTATWGVSDEDFYLIKRTKPLPNYRMKENHSLAVFSSSNHDPFEFPDGKN